MIKFEHSVFALPFALVGALLAARAAAALPHVRQILWIIVAMVGARSAAMTMNRIADIEYDRRNPRTANRALPAGELSVSFAWVFTALSSGGSGFGRLAVEPAGAEAFAARACHPVFLFLHEALHQLVALRSRVSASAFRPPRRGLPFAARSTGGCSSSARPSRSGSAVSMCSMPARTSNSTITAGLFSIPKRFGVARALEIARAMHVVMVLLLGWLAWSFHLAWPAWVGICVVAALLAYEHSLVKPNDLSKMNAAFFTVNGYISLLFLLFWGAAALPCIGKYRRGGACLSCQAVNSR